MSEGRPNIWAELPEFPMDAGFEGRGLPLGQRAGAERLGATVYELDPGGALMPYHFHRGPEEMLLVLRGRPTLRTPEGERELTQGEVVAFPVGPAHAHQVVNRSAEVVRYVMFSSRRGVDVCGYPDSGKTAAASPAQDGEEERFRAVFRDADATGYFEGERGPG